ncbi:MAG: hypothetical protein ATN35_00390 [Epulopiscium sp. Nele67-Bin004]|nr:MAG: hypothetical protein ATN35_00390 [Epulopiscium sp. Nele67-Bin004]
MREFLFETKNVNFKYIGASENVLNNVNLVIYKGDFVSIIGKNGAGKSTLCKALMGLIPTYIKGEFFGEILFEAKSIYNKHISGLAKKVGYVYQNFENQLVRHRVRDEVEFAPQNFGYEDYKKRAQWAMEEVGILHLEDEIVLSLSGGQKHLLALASVLALDPEVLILDDPTSQLDMMHSVMVYELLNKLNTKYDKTIIVVENNAKFITQFCNQVIYMDNGCVKFQNCINQSLPEINKLILNSQLIKEKYILQTNTNQFFANSTVLEVKNINHYFRSLNKKKKQILHDINLSFCEGEKVVILGNNGAGKTTLMRLMGGLIALKNGDILYNNKSIKKVSLTRISEWIAYLYQNPEEMFLHSSVQKDIELFPTSRYKYDVKELCDDIITKFDLQSLKEQDGRLLSGGEGRRATLAIGMAMTPAVMLLDEPTAALDVSSRNELFKLLSLIDTKVVIITTHDLSLVTEWSNRVIVMSQGEIVFDDTPKYFATSTIDMKKWGILKEEVEV